MFRQSQDLGRSETFTYSWGLGYVLQLLTQSRKYQRRGLHVTLDNTVVTLFENISYLTNLGLSSWIDL